MHPILTRQLAADFCCCEHDVLDAQHHFTVFTPHPDRRQYLEVTPCILKIAVVNGKLLFTGRADVIARCREAFVNASAPWFMEAGSIRDLDALLMNFGARVDRTRPYYICDAAAPVDTHSFDIARYDADAIQRLFRGNAQFHNAYGFEETAPDVVGVSASVDGKLLGMAGASADSPFLWQIGIDVLPEARGQGIAKMLVALLRNDIIAAGRLPYYSTGIAHIASQRVALRAGFLPAWFEIVASPIR